MQQKGFKKGKNINVFVCMNVKSLCFLVCSFVRVCVCNVHGVFPRKMYSSSQKGKRNLLREPCMVALSAEKWGERERKGFLKYL